MLRTPLTVKSTGQLCDLIDHGGRVIGTGFVPTEAHEAVRRCNASPDDMIAALRAAHTALLKYGGTQVAPTLMMIEAALRHA